MSFPDIAAPFSYEIPDIGPPSDSLTRAIAVHMHGRVRLNGGSSLTVILVPVAALRIVLYHLASLWCCGGKRDENRKGERGAGKLHTELLKTMDNGGSKSKRCWLTKGLSTERVVFILLARVLRRAAKINEDLCPHHVHRIAML